MMGARRRTAVKMALPLYGALLVVFLLLAILFSLLHPSPSLAQAQDEEVWFTVTFQGGGEFRVTVDGVSELAGVLQFDFLRNLDPINVYRDGLAYAEYKQTYPPSDAGGDLVEQDCVFKGQYDKKTRTLTGKYESTYSTYNFDVAEYKETFKGTLEGTLEYREAEYSDGELVDTIFTMKGKILCTGQAEYTDLDGDEEDESYIKNIEIDYDFVANGNTGPEEIGAEDGGGEGNKIPGPGSWWEWLTGTVVAGAIAAGTGLVNTLFGGTPPPAPATVTEPTPSPWTMPDMPEPGIAGGTVDPFDLQKYPNQPERNIVEGSLDYIGEGVYVHGKAALNTLWDTAGAVISGTVDFIGGTLKTIGTGYVEMGRLTYDVWSDPMGTLKDMVSPTVIGHTLISIGGEVLESINPMEEMEALNDPNMSPEGKCWAVSCIALKVANVLLIKDGLKDLKDSLIRRATKKPVVPGPEPTTPLKPAGRTSKMSTSDAIANAQKVLPEETIVEYEALKRQSKTAVDNFADKVKRGAEITTDDVLQVTKNEAVTREVLGKTERPISPKVKDAVKKGRRRIYDAVDDQVGSEMKKNPKYAKGEVKPKEVSTGGEADATLSTDRDVQYVHKKQVTGRDGKVTTVVEDVPAKDVRKIHNKAFAKESGFDPNKPARGIDPKKWKNMSLEEKQVAQAEQYGQNVIDRVSDEFIVEYRTDKVPGKLSRDPEWTAKIYQEDKFMKPWKERSVGKQTEALEQLRKMGDVADEAAGGSGKMLDQQTLDALDIIKDGSKAPAVRDQAVRNLGVPGGVEGLSNRFRSIIQSWK